MSGVFGSARTTSGFGGLTQTSSAGTVQDMANDPTLANPPEDSVSDICFSPQAEFLSVASWDKKVRIYEVSPQGQSREWLSTTTRRQCCPPTGLWTEPRWRLEAVITP